MRLNNSSSSLYFIDFQFVNLVRQLFNIHRPPGRYRFRRVQTDLAEAGVEKDYFHYQSIQSAVAIPFAIDRKTLGLLALTMLRNRREWPKGLIRNAA